MGPAEWVKCDPRKLLCTPGGGFMEDHLILYLCTPGGGFMKDHLILYLKGHCQAKKEGSLP